MHLKLFRERWLEIVKNAHEYVIAQPIWEIYICLTKSMQ